MTMRNSLLTVLGSVMLLGAALQITNTFGNPFLHDLSLNPLYQDSLSVRYPAVLLSQIGRAHV